MNVNNKYKQLKTASFIFFTTYSGQIISWLDKNNNRVNNYYNELLRKLKKIKSSFKRALNLFFRKLFDRKPSLEKEPEDLLNRQVYAKKIADTVEKRHSEGNVIFAISGKWGSGKTRILELLKPLLIKRGFKVVLFNTWNYSQEPISLKRAFLKALTKDLKNKADLSSLEQDTTELKFSINKLVRFLCPFILLFLILTIVLFVKDTVFVNNILYLSEYIIYTGKLVNSWITSDSGKLLIVPIVVFLLTDVFTLKQTSSRITTAEGFRSKFDEIVKDEGSVVVFVDDLDRCTPEVVKQILDALVTFFKNDCCSFVVTGDHTVIEQYVGNQLNVNPIYLSDGKKDEKKTRLQEVSEGRRFLKKLFDVYWQIPAPEPARFRQYVEKEIEKLDMKNLDETKQKQLVNLLSSFLEPNPRAVVRFLTGLSFNLDTLAYMVEEKNIGSDNHTDPSKELADIELKGLEEVVKEPVLLAKVLLIQELFYPLYVELVRQPDVLPLHEKEVRKKGEATTQLNGKPVDEFLIQNEDLGFYKDLLRTPPKFTDDNDAIIFNSDKFLYLSGFTGLPSQKGPDEEWFLQGLKTTTVAKDLITKLEGASDERQKQLLNLSQAALATSTEATEKQNIARNLGEIMLEVDTWSSGFNALVAKLTEANFIHGLQPPIRSGISNFIFQYAFEKDVDVASFFTETPWNDPIYTSVKWEAAAQITLLSTTAVTNLAPIIDSEFATNEELAITHLNILAEKSNQDEQDIQNILKPIFNKAVNVVFSKPADQSRLTVISALSNSDKKKLSKTIYIQKQTEVIQGTNFLSEIQFLLTNHQHLQEYLDSSELKSLRSAMINFLHNRSLADWYPLADVLLSFLSWEGLEKESILDTFFHHLQSTDAGMFNYALDYFKKPEMKKFEPPLVTLNKLFPTLTFLAEDRKEPLLDFLSKSNWPEVALLNDDNQKILTSLAKGRNNISRKTKEVLKGWGLKPPSISKTKASKRKRETKNSKK